MDKHEIIRLLEHQDTVVFLTTGNPGKQAELVRLMDDPTIPVLNLNDLATLLGVPAESLESAENENDYAAIASGKVALARTAVRQSGLPSQLMAKIVLVGDDYGAAAGALRFTHDPKAGEFAVDFDRDGHIERIRTNREELNNKPAPGYFSKRVKNAVARQRGIEPANKKAAFDAFAEELLHKAEASGDRSSTATVALAFGRVTEDSIGVIEKTADFILNGRIAEQGFDFDRIQALPDDARTVGDWSDGEKDKNFPRGQAVREALQRIKTQGKERG